MNNRDTAPEQSESPAFHSEVDARGQRCPMPLLMAKRGLNALETGQILSVLSTDSASRGDFSTFARQSGHELLLDEEAGGEYRFLLRKR